MTCKKNNEDESRVNEKIATAIERLSTIFRSALWEEAKQHQLSPLQTQILLFVACHAEELNNVSHLAKEFALTKATVSDAVRVLLEKQLLKKQASEDARGFNVALTSSGKKLTKKLSGLEDFFGNALEYASEEEQQKIWEGVLLLIGHLQKTGVIPLRMCFTCQHFSKQHPSGSPHYCHLMQAPLTMADLRIDCSEHQEKTPI